MYRLFNDVVRSSDLIIIMCNEERIKKCMGNDLKGGNSLGLTM
jgi:hypothetical protein